MKSYFSEQQLWFLVAGSVALAVSLYFFSRKNYRISLWPLIAAGALLFSFAALLDPFLNIWDERFHGLVAKNMMETPFTPMLYREQLIPIDYSFWASAHIWLHKQPWFLWQIALSFKCFGVSEFTLRLPGIITSTLVVPALYRTGKLLVNSRVGYLTAFLWVTSFYLYELISGRQMLDQNDVAFVGYISFSLWAWVEYTNSGKKYWLILIGLFAGAAVLTKWMVGLLVYLAWGVQKLSEKEFHPKKWLDMGFSLLLTLVLVLPWQFYTFSAFPEIAEAEWKYNALHFSQPVEGHGGDVWYHLERMKYLFGYSVPLVIIPGWILFYRKSEKPSLFYGWLAAYLGASLFFMMAVTKMPSFTFILAAPVFLVTAIFMEAVISFAGQLFPEKTKVFPVVLFIILFGLGLHRINPEELQKQHTTWMEDNDYTRMLSYNRALFLRLDKKLPEKAVLFNVKGRHYVEAMFYTGNTAYRELPTEDQLAQLHRRNRPVWIFQKSDSKLPEYILNDPKVTLIREQLQGYE